MDYTRLSILSAAVGFCIAFIFFVLSWLFGDWRREKADKKRLLEVFEDIPDGLHKIEDKTGVDT